MQVLQLVCSQYLTPFLTELCRQDCAYRPRKAITARLRPRRNQTIVAALLTLVLSYVLLTLPTGRNQRPSPLRNVSIPDVFCMFSN